MPEKGQLADDEECPVDKYYRPTFIQRPPEDTKAVEGKLVRFDVKVKRSFFLHSIQNESIYLNVVIFASIISLLLF